jgi:VanZ family protein
MINNNWQKNTLRSAVQYLGCCLLVILYVNLYPVWKIANNSFSATFIRGAPVLITVLLAGGLLFYFYRSSLKNAVKIRWSYIIFGLVLCFSALFISDPEISAKRIHVPEYLLLSLYVRYVMSHKMRPMPLLLFSSIFTLILGIHDEFLQGLHPRRTYGLRDLLVNTIAGTGGGFIWHGFDLFSRNFAGSPPLQKKSTVHSTFLFWLLLALSGLIVPLYFYRSYAIPAWPFFPLIAASLFYFCLLRNDSSDWSHGLLVISYSSFSLLLYPMVINGAKILFY